VGENYIRESTYPSTN